MNQSIAANANESYVPFIESDPHAAGDELAATMQEQGYLFLRGVVPVNEVLAVRCDILELCREFGWVDVNQDLMEGVVPPGVQPLTEGEQTYMAMYRRLLKLPRFHDFPCQPSLMHVAHHLLGDHVLVHPRRIGRVSFPNNLTATTPPHQDHFYIRGTVETYSCWVPLGDCPMSLGSLAVWAGSHRRGFIEHSVTHPGAVGGRGVPVEETAAWHASDFSAGDALFFHSYTIHKALPNLSGDRLRLSTDNRYQREQDDVDPSSLRPHFDLN